MEIPTRRHEAVVIGAGPGGYVAAIRLAQLGVKTALVEREVLGGACLNWGCIPSKALISAANLVDSVRRAAARGIAAEPTIDVTRLRAFKNEVVKKLSAGVGALERGNGVEIIQGTARFLDPGTVEVAGSPPQRIEAGAFVVATGARPVRVPGFDVDGVDVWGAKEAVDIREIPRRLVVIGGGVIGVELGTAYQKLGSNVTIVEALPGILTGVDPDAVRVVERELAGRGVTVQVSAKAKRLQRAGGQLSLDVEVAGEQRAISCDKVLVAAGFRPDGDAVGLANAGVALGPGGFVAVDEQMRTSVPSIFCIGDLAGPPLLAHKASREGELAAAVIAGKNVTRDWRAMPVAIFSDPEVAQVGISEAQARADGFDVVTGKFAFAALGRAVAMDEVDGFVKVTADRATKALLGVTLVGPAACELVAEASLALEMEAHLDDVAHTVHAHPTLPEAFMEACKVALGEAIHAMNRKERSGSADERPRARP